MNAPTILTPDPTTGLVTVTAGYTPSNHVHTPDSTYAQFYTTPTIGPLCYLAWSRLNMWIDTDDTTVIVAFEELAWSLGASPARLQRAITRLAKFHYASIDPAAPDTLRIQRRAATLNPAQLAALAAKCPSLVEAHTEQVRSAA